MPLATGQILNNRYRIVRLLGQGGFGAVYRAWDLNLNSPVALKENLATSPEAVKQFEIEARLLANLRHENLPYVIDHFILPGQGQYMVMEFIEGDDLQTLMDRSGGPLPEAQVVPWIQQVCDALDYLHTQSPPIIHRDIKPANIKITPKGKVVLVDFGIAKLYSPVYRTMAGARAVTQGYSPPEQYGGGSTDARSDIYALGATLYAALTGETPVESLQRQLGQSLIPPQQLNPLIPPWVEQAILKSMELEPNRRYQHAGEFKVALSTPIVENLIAQPPVEISPLVQKTQVASSPDKSYPPADMPTIPAHKPPAKVVPAPKRSWFGIAASTFIVLCLILTILGGGGVYAFLWLSDRATQTVQSIYSSGTGSAIALHTAQATSPSPPEPTSAWTSSPIPSIITPPSPSPTWMPTFTEAPAVTFPPTFTPSPTFTKTPKVKATWYPCPGTYPSRLHVGDIAYVSYNPPLPNRVRSEPNTSSTILGVLQVGEKMEILDGPACSEGWIWWQVSSLEKPLAGWTAEGDDQHYWLVPMP